MKLLIVFVICRFGTIYQLFNKYLTLCSIMIKTLKISLITKILEEIWRQVLLKKE